MRQSTYNGEGERVQQIITIGGTTTTTQYVGSYEEVSVTGGTTTTTKHYQAGLVQVINVNGTLSYLASDSLGSIAMALSITGTVNSAQLFTPYGAIRYTSGISMPTTYGFTGQRLDPSGLSYMHARYYDSVVGQFTSADTMQGNNRYAYVRDNPATNTDPTGNYVSNRMLFVDGGDDNASSTASRSGTSSLAAAIAAIIKNIKTTTLSQKGSSTHSQAEHRQSSPQCDAQCLAEFKKNFIENATKDAEKYENENLLLNDGGLLVTDLVAGAIGWLLDDGFALASATVAFVGDVLNFANDLFKVSGNKPSGQIR